MATTDRKLEEVLAWFSQAMGFTIVALSSHQAAPAHHMRLPRSPCPVRALPPCEMIDPTPVRPRRRVSSLIGIPWHSAIFCAANVGPKSPYRCAYSVSAVVLTVSGSRRFDGFPRPQCASPWSPTWTCVNFFSIPWRITGTAGVPLHS